MADPQPIDAPPGVDPSVVAAMQGGFAAPGPQMQQRMYDAPPPMQDSYPLPEPVAQAVQSQFAQPPQPLPPPPTPPDVPVGVIDNGKFVASPPPGFVPQPLVNPFPEPTAADKKAADAAAKAQALAAKADAQKQAKAAAYAATPQGQFDQAAKTELAANKEQSDIAGQTAEVGAQASDAESAIRDKALIDQQNLIDAQNKAQADAFAERKRMLDDYSKAIDEQAKKTVDPNRMYNSQSTAQHIGTAAGIFLAGLGSGQGENPALKMVSQAIDRDIDAQKSNIENGNKDLANKKGLIDDYGHLSDKENDQFELRRAQYYKMEGDRIAASASHFNSPQKLLAGQQAQAELHAKAGTILANLAEKKQADSYKQAELRNQRDQIAIAGYHASIADRAQKFDEKKFGIETAQKKMLADEAHQAKLDEIGATAAAKAAAKGKAAEGELMVPTGALVPSPFGGMTPSHEKLQNQPVAPTPDNPTGENPFSLKTVGGPAEQSKVMEKFTAGTQLVGDLDELRALYAENGGSLNKWNAAARAKAQALTRSVIHAHQAYGIAGFKGPVVEMMDKAILGTNDEGDVNSVLKDLGPQLDSVRQHAIQERRMILGPNFTGDAKQLEIPDPLDPKNKPPESNQSKFLRIVETKPPESEAPRDHIGQIIDQIQNPSKAATEFGKDGLSDSQRQVMNAISMGLSGFQTHEHAVEQLKQIVGDPKASSAIRDVAQAQLDRLGFPKVTVNPDEQ